MDKAMKRIKYGVLFATLLFGSIAFTSCSTDKGEPSEANEEVKKEREELLAHVENEATWMADSLNFDALNMMTRVNEQLLEAMNKDPRFADNLKKVVTMLAARNALSNMKPVEAGSELAQMGYSAYIPIDISAFGVRVIFDEEGNYRFDPIEGLEFIFPATIEGYGATAYKWSIKNNGDWYESVSPVHLNGVRGLACVSRIPKSFTMTMSGLFDDKVVTMLKGVVNIHLDEDAESDYVSFEGNAFQVEGQLTSCLQGAAYGLPNGDGQLNISYGIDQTDRMNIGFDFTQHGRRVMDGNARMELPQKKTVVDQLTDFLLDRSRLGQEDNLLYLAQIFAGNRTDVTLNILDELTLSGTIDDGTQFCQALYDVKQQGQDSPMSADEFDGCVQRLNQACNFFLSCPHISQPVPFQWVAIQEDTKQDVQPALLFADNPEYIPLSELVGETTMDNIKKTHEATATAVGGAAGVSMQFISRLVQFMPLNIEEWEQTIR